VGASVLVSEVIEEARFRVDANSGASTYVNDAAMLRLVKFSARRLSAMIRREFGGDYFTSRTTLTTTPSSDTVALPGNFSDLRQIAWVRGSNDVVPMSRAGVDDWRASSETATAWDAAPTYQIQSSNLLVFPKPNQAYTLSIYYDTGIYVTSTSDSIDAQPGWEEWLINDVCIRIRMREDLEFSSFEKERSIAAAEIKQQAAQRDRVGVHTVRDLWGDGSESIDPRSLFARR